MAPIVPDPKKIKTFRTEAAFEAWLAANHARETELWLKIHKKASGLPTITYAQALDVARFGACGSSRGDRGEPTGTPDLPDARTSESLRARISNEQHEDARTRDSIAR